MPLLTLPPRLKSLYEQSPHRPAADLAQHSFMHWLDNFTKPLTFFPEYTDHGRPHLESVLTSATRDEEDAEACRLQTCKSLDQVDFIPLIN